MSEFDKHQDEISLMALSTILLRRRWRIVRLVIAGAMIAGLWAWLRPAKFVAYASFVPASTDASRSGLANLAGQFGLSLPAGNQSVSPEFYASLLQSRALLLPIARDSFVVPDVGGQRRSLLDLLEIPGKPTDSARREDAAVKTLQRMVGVSTAKSTGVVLLAVSSRWRSVSLAIASNLVTGVNDYNQRTRQGQAAAERKFVEGRLELAAAELRTAEDRLRQFLEGNRNIGNAPELSIERDRIQRNVSLRQQVYTSLTQSYEEARVREVRDTPVITSVEAPWAPVEAEGRGLLKYVLLGAVLGGVIEGAIAVAQELTRRRSGEGDKEAAEFVGTLSEVKGEVLGPVRWMKRRVAP